MSEARTIKVDLLPDTGEPNSCIFCLGSSGSGKTTLIANLLRVEKRWIIFDTRNEYSPQFFTGQVALCEDYSGFITHLNDGRHQIILKADKLREGVQEECLSASLNSLVEFQMKNPKQPPVTFALDELDKFVSAQNTCSGLEEVIKRGRGPRIKKLLGSQWFGRIPTWVRDSFTEIYAFRHVDGAGLDRLRDYGFDPEQLQNLVRYHCAYSGPDGKETLNLSTHSGERLD